MGGNIKFNNPTSRISAKEYIELMCTVTPKIAMHLFDRLDDRNWKPIPAYFSKESFGDMDIIINTKYLVPNWKDVTKRIFKLEEGDFFNESKSGLFSFEFKNFQIDLITMPDEDFESAINYYSWNDCGNLVGRIAHKLGVKYGHRGLHLVVKEETREIGEILLTKDAKKIHELLDLDYEKFSNGFNTLEEMYTYVTESRYFNKDIYSFENRNHAARTRDKKRSSYNGFLAWCEGKTFKNNFPYDEITSLGGYNIREPFFTDLIAPMFPHAKIELAVLRKRHEDDKKIKEIVSSYVIMKLTGLEGKEAGDIITEVKKKFWEDHTREEVLAYWSVDDFKQWCEIYLAFRPENIRPLLSALDKV